VAGILICILVVNVLQFLLTIYVLSREKTRLYYVLREVYVIPVVELIRRVKTFIGVFRG
jgi:hypothetical protein